MELLAIDTGLLVYAGNVSMVMMALLRIHRPCRYITYMGFLLQKLYLGGFYYE
jgi:predicted branched-subunit amino acid permease